ncbi:MAG: DUF4190 domain-containing protein [Planctomycetota bacterium]
MPGGPHDESPKCERCGRVSPPRRGRPVRYCPVCGERLLGLHEEVQRALAAPRTSLSSVATLILGILGLVPGCGLPAALAAVVLGIVATERVRNSNGALAGAGLATVGLVLGLVGLAFSGLMCIAH